MSPKKNILIIDDDSRLRSQLKRLTKEVIADCNILEADNYDSAIELINNHEINILVCDLFLSSNENKITIKDYIPKGIKVAQEAKKKNSNSFVIIVTSYLDSFLSNHHLLDYMQAGVNAFFDRAVTPYEKFSEPFKYQLQIASESIIFPDDSISKLWEIQNIKSYRSYWILICDLNDQNYHNLISDCLILEKTLPKPGASVLLLDIHDEDKLSYLIENNLLNDIDDYPILLIGESPEMLPNIKITSSLLRMIQESGNLTKFLNLIHTRLRYKNISEIAKQMELPEYWYWLNINNIKGFSSEKGLIEFDGGLKLINSKKPDTYNSVEEPKIFRDKIGNLVIETDHKTFVAIPQKKGVTATATSAARSISTGTAAFMPKSATELGSDTSISSVKGFAPFGSLMGIYDGAIVTGLSPNAFLTRITKELSNNGYTYLKLEKGNAKTEKTFVWYVAFPAISIPEEEKVYKLVLAKNPKKDRRDVFDKVIASFKDSPNWSVCSDILGEKEEASYLLLPKTKDKYVDKIRAKILMTKTLDQVFRGDHI